MKFFRITIGILYCILEAICQEPFSIFFWFLKTTIQHASKPIFLQLFLFSPHLLTFSIYYNISAIEKFELHQESHLSYWCFRFSLFLQRDFGLVFVAFKSQSSIYYTQVQIFLLLKLLRSYGPKALPHNEELLHC